MAEKSDYLDTIHSECRNLRNIVGFLDSLAVSFSRTGNGSVSDELFKIAAEIWDSQENIRVAVGEDVNKRWKDSQEMSRTIFKSVLAGMELQKKGKDENT
jgi:hypothetical protein